jgi:hypothetical protein
MHAGGNGIDGRWMTKEVKHLPNPQSRKASRAEEIMPTPILIYFDRTG